jgi:hypothetical protein
MFGLMLVGLEAHEIKHRCTQVTPHAQQHLRHVDSMQGKG